MRGGPAQVRRANSGGRSGARLYLAFLLLAAAGVLVLMAAPARGHESCSPRGGGDVVVPPPDWDWDCDSVPDTTDNCPPIGYDNLATRNPNQDDSDSDGMGDACESDDDADTVPDWTDGQVDYMSTKVKRDNCRTFPNPDQLDENPRNGVGDACQIDSDGDLVFDTEDNCDRVQNPDQSDADGDLAGDACDNDPDGDYVRDTIDNCPGIPNPQVQVGSNWVQPDADGDGSGDACDTPPSPPPPVDTTPPPPPAPPGTARVFDRQAPRVTLSVRASQYRDEVEDGLIVRVRCSEACSAKVDLVVDRALARRMKLRRTTVASGAAKVEAAATTYAFVRFDRAARRALWKRSRTALTLKVAATDAAGNTRRVSERLMLRR